MFLYLLVQLFSWPLSCYLLYIITLLSFGLPIYRMEMVIVLSFKSYNDYCVHVCTRTCVFRGGKEERERERGDLYLIFRSVLSYFTRIISTKSVTTLKIWITFYFILCFMFSSATQSGAHGHCMIRNKIRETYLWVLKIFTKEDIQCTCNQKSVTYCVRINVFVL